MKLVAKRYGMEKELNVNSNIDNHRVRVEFVDKSGRVIVGYLGHGTKYRFTSLRGNKKLKKPIVVHEDKLYLDLSYENDDGCFRYNGCEIVNLYDWIDTNDIMYNSEDILRTINLVSDVKYTELEVIDCI